MGKPYTHADAVRDLDPVQRVRYDAFIAAGSPATVALEHADHDHDDGGCVEAPSPQLNTQEN